MTKLVARLWTREQYGWTRTHLVFGNDPHQADRAICGIKVDITLAEDWPTLPLCYKCWQWVTKLERAERIKLVALGS